MTARRGSGGTAGVRGVGAGIVALAWLSAAAVDFALHAGLLAPLYDWSSPFLISRLDAFARIPVGYGGLLLLVAGLAWLLPRIEVSSGPAGARAGATIGAVAGAAFLAALWSISTAETGLLAGWWLAVVIELGIAGWVVGEGLAGRAPRSLLRPVLLILIAGVATAVVLQGIGFAEPLRI